MPENPITIATRGSALALAQANFIAAQCREFFPRLRFELKIVKTTGDKLQRSSLVEGGLPKGLFTKELEAVLLKGKADLAVHSLKDLPTELPDGLALAATPKRADVRDVLIYRSEEHLAQEAPGDIREWAPGQSQLRGLKAGVGLKDLPRGATIATSSTRRKMQLLAARPDFKIVEIRGNIPTRLLKLSERGELDGMILALAGLNRLNFQIQSSGSLTGDAVPEGLLGRVLELDEMLPCVGQGAIGVETRADDERVSQICERLNHFNTFQCATAERAFLRTMGGGCQSPVAAHAQVVGDQIVMTAVSYRGEAFRSGQMKGRLADAAELGETLAKALK